MIIQTINLTKRYGKLVALNNLHLNIEEGECFGYIGPNGCGQDDDDPHPGHAAPADVG